MAWCLEKVNCLNLRKTHEDRFYFTSSIRGNGPQSTVHWGETGNLNNDIIQRTHGKHSSLLPTMNTAQEFLVPLERNQRGETKQLTVVGKQVRQRMLLDHP